MVALVKGRRARSKFCNFFKKILLFPIFLSSHLCRYLLLLQGYFVIPDQSGVITQDYLSSQLLLADVVNKGKGRQLKEKISKSYPALSSIAQ